MAAPIGTVDDLKTRLSAGRVTTDELRELLSHTLAPIRAQAAEALAARRDFEPVAALLNDPEPTLRVQTVAILARARDESAAYRFTAAVRHSDPDVRRAAFDELLKWTGKGRDKLLLAAMDDRDPRRRRAALDRLDSLEGIARALRDPALRERAEELLAAVKDERLVGALAGEEDAAARTLLKKRGPSAVALLLPKLEQEKDAALALDLIFDLSPEPARVASKAWPRMATPARLAALDRVPELAQAAAHDPDERVRRVAVRTLLRQGDWDPAWAVYLRLPPGTDNWTESDLVLIVRNIAQGPGGIEPLSEAARGPVAPVRREAALSLRKKNATEALASLAETDDGFVIREVALGLAEADDARSIIPLIRTIRESRGGAKRQAADYLKKRPETATLDFAIEALHHRRGSVRLWAAEKLEGVEDPRAVDPLLRLLDDTSAECQHAAVRALSRFAAEARVTERLIGCLSIGDLSVRQAAIEVLGEAKATAAVPALIRVLGNGFLKPKAAAALKTIGDRKGFLAVLRRKRRDEQVAKERDRVRALNRRRK
jgi:HEAT repeat protein